ncbi:hypothetical protein [Umezawaea sp. Da 62-37]|uniref:hypothetical protein n=1 Tax=Umezawaea sp. Da 62-37 TaxID=3075927 RepID=UPI0028F6C835|nr:hypothetical protein [Umezawaea sp. Da 62-37]WNV82243.1 hypothetical protein RM788_28995 [Umezawaea sp. Da 62-37]
MDVYVSAQGYPLVAIRLTLETPWDYAINPDGTKTLLLRDDLGLEQTLVMIDDLLHDRHNGCQIWADHVRKSLCLDLGISPGQITARMIYELAQHNVVWATSDVGGPRVPESRQSSDSTIC